MAPYHNNQLNVVGLFDSDETYNSPCPSSAMSASATSGYGGIINAGYGYLHGHEHAPQVTYGFGVRPVEPERFIASTSANQNQERKDGASFKTEAKKNSVSYTPSHDSDYYESASEDVSPHKVPKLNKDGAPRKPRQPRPKLLKWTDNDWKNAVLGIIWACGEQGVHIPFGQAAKVVGENCTASALQQAVLKLRSKQIAAGHKIPALAMPWQRKDKKGRSSTPIANPKSAQIEAKSESKSLTWKRVLKKVKGSLVVKLKVGRQGINKKEPEARLLPMKDMQPETSMLSMNGINSMQTEAHMLPTNNMQTGAHMLPTNDMFSSVPTPVYWAESRQPLMHQGQPLYHVQQQAMQPPQPVSPATRSYNRNHVVLENGLFDEYYNMVGTVDDFPGFERINTPEGNFPLSEDPINMENQSAMLSMEDLNDLHGQEQELQNQLAISNSMHGLSDLHSQEQESLDLPEDFIDLSSFTDYAAHLAGQKNYLPQEDVFKTDF